MAVKSEHVQSITDHESSPDRKSIETPRVFDEPSFDPVSDVFLKSIPPGIDAHAAAVRRLQGDMRTRVMTQFQQDFGNRYVQRVMDQLHSTEQPADDLAQRIQAASADGNGLDATTRERLQTGLGVDLSGVRVHLDDEADRLAESVEAIAFTTGNDIFFRAGRYQPETAWGLRLLAHEVTHTLQQSNGPVDGTLNAGGVSISDPSDGFEQAAEQVADQIVGGRGAAPGYQSAATNAPGLTAVQRQEGDYEDQLDGGLPVGGAEAPILDVDEGDGTTDGGESVDTSEVAPSTVYDYENDWWHTKQLLGQKWGGVADAGISAAWNAGGLLPGVGSAVGVIGAGVDGYKALAASGLAAYHTATGDLDQATAAMKASERFADDMAFSELASIPGSGTVQTAAAYDIDAAEFVNRLSGGTPGPLSSDIYHEGIKPMAGAPEYEDDQGNDQGAEGSGGGSYIDASDPTGSGGYGGGPYVDTNDVSPSTMMEEIGSGGAGGEGYGDDLGYDEGTEGAGGGPYMEVTPSSVMHEPRSVAGEYSADQGHTYEAGAGPYMGDVTESGGYGGGPYAAPPIVMDESESGGYGGVESEYWPEYNSE